MARKLNREEELAFYKFHSCKKVILSPRMDCTSGFMRIVTIAPIDRQPSEAREISLGENSSSNDDWGL